MKKLSSKAKKATIITGVAVVCVGVLCFALYQNHAIADSGNLLATSSEMSTTASVNENVSVAPIISGNDTVISGTAGTGSAWAPSSGKSTSAPLTPSVSKPQAPAKPTVQGDSVNGKQPTNSVLTNKAQKPAYTTPPKAPTQKSTGGNSGSGTTTTKPSGGNSSSKSGGSTKGNPILDNAIREPGGNQQKVVDGDWGGGSQVGIMD